MIRLQDLQTALAGLVGLMPHQVEGFAQYPDDLLASRSGILLTNPLIQPRTLLAASLDISTMPQLAASMRMHLRNAVAQVVSQLLTQKKLEGSRTVIDDTVLYVGAGSINNRIVKAGRFCGFMIEAEPGRDLAIRIGRMALQVDTNNPALPIYIYHSAYAQPLKVFTVNVGGSGIFSWADIADTFLATEYPKDGFFVVGYYEADLAGQVIDMQKDWTDAIVAGVGCSSCNPAGTLAFQTWSKYMSIHPFSVPASLLNAERTLWEPDSIRYAYKSNFGLNMGVSIECDMTQYLVRNENILADVIAKQATVNILETFVGSLADNDLAEKCRQNAMYQLDNRADKTPGLRDEVAAAIKALSVEVSQDNSPCFPTQEIITQKAPRISHGVI
jgi:hypothetical protein